MCMAGVRIFFSKSSLLVDSFSDNYIFSILHLKNPLFYPIASNEIYYHMGNGILI